MPCEAERLYVSAGAPPPLLCPAWNGGAAFTACEAAGLPLGITGAPRYELRRVPFARDSLFLLYSDAVLETPDPLAAGSIPKSWPIFWPGAISVVGARAPYWKSGRRWGAAPESGLPDDLTIVALHHGRDDGSGGG